MPPILLDTHAAIWSANGSLRPALTRTINAAADAAELLLSPITAWEIGMLVSKGRLELVRSVEDYVRALFGQPGIVTADLTPDIGVGASMLPGFHADPADRIIVATAAAYGAQLVTRDKGLLAYAKATKTFRCIAC